MALPTPQMKVTGRGARNAAASRWLNTENPRGLSRSEASFARNLFSESPIDTVMPILSSTARAKPASDFAGEWPCSRSVPERSRNASSIESGSTSGVNSSISARTSRPTHEYFAMSGGTTAACGHRRRA